MKRRDFLKKAGLLTAGSFALPYILPSGSLSAKTSSRKANKVVYCLFAGGVRLMESIEKQDGNLMPGMLAGNERISGDISHAMTPVPQSPLPQPLQRYGTLYKNFLYAQGPTGHYQGHVTAVTGRYTDNSLNLRGRPPYPTIFELYLKHNSPTATALNAWWVSNTLGTMHMLNYGVHPQYGAPFAANFLSPNTFVQRKYRDKLGSMIELMHEQERHVEDMRGFLNRSFSANQEAAQAAMKNVPEDAEKVQNFISDLFRRHEAGEFNDPWGVGSAFYNDMRTVFFAEQVMQQFQPELLVVNMQGVDICHNDFTRYCDNMRKADYAVAHLWHTIQNTPGMADDTVLIIVPEHGRNLEPNTIQDDNGRYAVDHTGDEMSRKIFSFVVGPPHIVKQNQTISEGSRDGGAKLFESPDTVATAAYVLGFYDAVAGQLDGQPLYEAFV